MPLPTVDLSCALSPTPPADRVPALRAATARLQQRQADGEVGFLRVGADDWEADATVAAARRLHEVADTLLVLGIGGSALGAIALQDALGPSAEGRRVVVLDTVDPGHVAETLADLHPSRTAVAAVSKSGGTLETTALWRVVQPWLAAAVGDGWRARTVVVTDPERGDLRAMARAEGLASLPVPPDVGGRFSVLTAVGLLPAAFLGLDVAGLLHGGRDAAHAALADDFDANPAWRFAAVHHAWYGAGARVSVFCPYVSRLRVFGHWYAQLWAESLGKRRPDGTSVGWTPAPALGPADQHSQLQLWQEGPDDKLLTFVSVDDPGAGDVPLGAPPGAAGVPGAWLAGRTLGEILDAERRGTIEALASAGRPVVQIVLPRLDEASWAALAVTLQAATAYAGDLLGIEPFDQPGVEGGKRIAKSLLASG